MIFVVSRIACFFTAFFLIFSPFCFAQQKYSPYPGIIHIHSNVSEGTYPLRKIAALAHDKGIKIIIFSDSFLRRWEYGIPVPLLRNILKVSVQQRSVSRYGIKRYLEDIEKIRLEFADTVIIGGVEAAPFYWWSGTIFKKNLVLNDWNRHLLVIGLRKPSDYAHLPVINYRGRFDAYHGPKGYLPYQDLINYVNQKSGLAFWAHPEVTESMSVGRLFTTGFYTSSYPGALWQTKDFTGFGINLGTKHDIILSGNEWDKALTQYCQGRRERPVWVIGELDYRNGNKIDTVQNIFLLPELNEEAVFDALYNGRLYVRPNSKNPDDISLTDFYIEDSSGGGRPALLGEEIAIKNKPKLYIRGNCILNAPDGLQMEIIRDGRVIKKFNLGNAGEFNLEFEDGIPLAAKQKSYYRLNLFTGSNIILVANPIFVRMADG